MTTNTRQRFAQLPSTRLVLTLLFGMASLLLALPGRAIAATSQLDQSDVNGGCWVAFDDNLAQTFTAGITGDLDMVRVLVYKVAANGAPTGQLLGSETVERPAGTEDYRWYEVALDPPAPIISGSQYAIVLTRPSDSTVGDYGWITDCSGGYTGGDRWVYNGVWRNVGGDFAFQTYVVHKPDTAAPDTTIGTKPANPTNSTSASFSFNGDDGTGSGVASFECSLDGAAFANCASTGISYSDLSEGSHTFAVKATDNANNTDTTPASYTWTVDTTAPAQPATPDLAEVSDSAPRPATM